MEKLKAALAYIRKQLILLSTLAGALLTLGLLPDEYASYVATGISVIGAIVHYLTPNGGAPSDYALADVPALEDDETEPTVEDLKAVGATETPHPSA